MSELDKCEGINGNIPLQITIDKTNESSSKNISRRRKCNIFFHVVPLICPNNYVPLCKHNITITPMHGLSDNLTEEPMSLISLGMPKHSTTTDTHYKKSLQLIQMMVDHMNLEMNNRRGIQPLPKIHMVQICMSLLSFSNF